MSTAPVLMFERGRLGNAVHRSRKREVGVDRGLIQPREGGVPEVAGRLNVATRDLKAKADDLKPQLRRPVCNGAKLRLVKANAEAAVPERKIAQENALTFDPSLYRKHTEGLLRRYQKMQMEMGRTPSWMGRDLFRTGVVNHNSVYSFEDVVIFVCDVEKCVQTLDATQQRLLTRVGMQAYTPMEVAGLMGTSERSVVRWYREALDELTRVLIVRGVMKPFVC